MEKMGSIGLGKLAIGISGNENIDLIEATFLWQHQPSAKACMIDRNHGN
ncbi:Glycine zipper 2TM domain family protein [Aspergillus niger]|uniref:Glycine zipper 2TM domain family protein n=1 Tax=Aspergillus niger TaxID=5061 RepID=A0A505HQQ0_ASPNG|nr:Glycine zipper 2TM domain family protein [Aspergillus niger]